MNWASTVAVAFAARIERFVEQIENPVKYARRMTWLSAGAVAIILGVGGTLFMQQSIISDPNEHQATAGMTISEGAVTESSPDTIETPAQTPDSLVTETAATPDPNEHQTPADMTVNEGAILESSQNIVTMPSKEPSELVRETPVPSNNNEQRVEKLLTQAATALKEYRLTTPKNNNAHAYYQRILALHPQHRTALKGINGIADAYADLSERKLDQYDYKAAKEYVRRGLTIQPENTRLLALQKNTNAFRDAPKRMWKKSYHPSQKRNSGKSLRRNCQVTSG